MREQSKLVERLREISKSTRDSYCQTVSAMHEAALCEIRGPKRGVVEDVEDIRLLANHRLDLLKLAWGIIANATDWYATPVRDEWIGAAERWRDQYHEELAKHNSGVMDDDVTEGEEQSDMQGHSVESVASAAIGDCGEDS